MKNSPTKLVSISELGSKKKRKKKKKERKRKKNQIPQSLSMQNEGVNSLLRLITSFTAIVPSCTAVSEDNEPLKLPIGVLAAATMTGAYQQHVLRLKE